jgi:predicted ATPase/DNA-binding CsgD family transcriptional regulator
VAVGNLAAAGNLPAEPTSFVGRRRLLAEVKTAFTGTRLLTLVGPGGVGKTRLALRAAADLRRSVRDGAWFVELAGLDDPHLVAKAVMSALGLVDQSGQWPTSVLVAHLAPREAVLVVDNCEHLLDPIAVLADVLLKEAPGVRLLATSRQPLGISGEHVVQVPSLTLADGGDAGPAQGFAHSEAVALLVERARNAGVLLEVNESNRQLVTDLCRRLDGMPLALELAAVRLRTIGLDQLVERLSDRFAVLTGGTRAALPRQQTLKATIDWSHDLLTATEAAVLRRLAVFPSDFGLDAAEAVASGEDVARASVLELLAELVEKSFVARLGVAARARYRLHETMREYAMLKLRAADEEAATVKTFVGFYASICQAARGAAHSPQVVEWLKRLDEEAPNLRAALAHCLNGPDHRTGLTMVGSLGWYWAPRATSEGMYWLDLFLRDRERDVQALAYALFARGVVALMQGDAGAATSALVDAEAKAREVGDLPLLARALAVSARARAVSGDIEGARAQAGEAAAVALGVDDPGASAAVTATQGFIAQADQDLVTARRVYDESLPRARAHGDLTSLTYILGYYGFTLLGSGQSEEVRPVFEESLEIARRLENRASILYMLYGLACHDAMVGQLERAARLLGAAEDLQAETGVRLIPQMGPLLAQARGTIVRSLGAATLESEVQVGRLMPRAEAIAYALEEKRVDRPTAPAMRTGTTPLSKRELEVARLVAEGLSNKEIGSRLFLSERTVETHVSKILNRLGINSRVEIASWVAQEQRPD